MKLLTKAFVILICMCMLSGCGVSQDALDDAWFDGHEEGYRLGYEDGYEEGLWEVYEYQEDIASAVRDAYSEMERQTTKERGLHPEEAILILKDYMNGEYVSPAELKTAIRSITYFYYHAWDVINDIDDMDVEFDFN